VHVLEGGGGSFVPAGDVLPLRYRLAGEGVVIALGAGRLVFFVQSAGVGPIRFRYAALARRRCDALYRTMAFAVRELAVLSFSV
jgi:hypothetical protein